MIPPSRECNILAKAACLQLGVDYYLPHLTFKSLVGLTASPTVVASASTGWNDLTLGGQATFDTAKDESLTTWTAGVGESSKYLSYCPSRRTRGLRLLGNEGILATGDIGKQKVKARGSLIDSLSDML